MNSETLSILERSLSRVRDEHVGALLMVMNDAISVIHPERPATVSESLGLFQEKTFSALKEYVTQARLATLSVIENTNIKLSQGDKAAVLALVKKNMEPALYSARFVAYEGAFSRHVARFGGPFQLSEFRSDLTKATYEIGVCNTVHSFLAALSDELEIIVQKQKSTKGKIKPFFTKVIEKTLVALVVGTIGYVTLNYLLPLIL